MESPAPPPTAGPEPTRWQRLRAASVRHFHTYANWLVGISWWRFAFLSIVLLLGTAILSELPPFTWTISETITERPARPSELPQPPKPPKLPKSAELPAPPEAPAPAASTPGTRPIVRIEKSNDDGSEENVEISIGRDGVKVVRKPKPAQAADAAASAASAAQHAADAASAAVSKLRIELPSGVDTTGVREAVEAARAEIERAIEEAKEEAEQARRDAEQAREDAEQAAADALEALGDTSPRIRISKVRLGDFLSQLALLWIVGSIIIKATYKGRVQAEVKAAQATEAAEGEALKRQVVEARMAAMQAQVEPHFLFNTLASIDHLIETDAPRASKMQRNLISLLRASMPTMREANAQESRDLGRELAVIKPYLEILKVRMEERLMTEIAVPDGLLSAEFPSMMLQSLVENAIKHGLEPKPEGGLLRVVAEIVHGQLVVTVSDTGLGFGKAATAGTGVGLANIRERLQLLYGQRASLSITENAPSGTRVSISLPYTPKPQAGAPA